MRRRKRNTVGGRNPEIHQSLDSNPETQLPSSRGKYWSILRKGIGRQAVNLSEEKTNASPINLTHNNTPTPIPDGAEVAIG